MGALTRALDGASDEVIAYVAAHLRRWPEAIARAVPLSWLLDALDGCDERGALALCDTLSTPLGFEFDEAQARALVERPIFASLTKLVFDADTFERRAWEAIVDAPAFARFTSCALRHVPPHVAPKFAALEGSPHVSVTIKEAIAALEARRVAQI